MSEQRVPPPLRVYGMMRDLIRDYANAEETPAAAPRGVVELQDALDAVMQVAAVIDEYTQSGAIPPKRGVFAGACLMVIRDYLRPLPRPLPAGPDEDGRDELTDDLRVMVAILRTLHPPDSLPDDD